MKRRERESTIAAVPEGENRFFITQQPRKIAKISKSPAVKHAARIFEDSRKQAGRIASLEQQVVQLQAEKKQAEQQHAEKEAALTQELHMMQTCLEICEHEKSELENTLNRLQQQLHVRSRYLTFDDLHPGGLLANHVKQFTFFTTVECNEEFLRVINYTDDDYDGTLEEGDGLCERYRRYSTVSIEQRVAEQQSDKTYSTSASNDETPGTSGETLPSDGSRCGQKRKLDYRTEWLIYNLYIHAGWTELQIEPLDDVGYTTIYNIIYFWANLLNDVLTAWFPRVTRSQLLRAYRQAILRKHAHCRIGPLLDEVHACLFSAYKNHPTVKFLAGCDGIGVTWADILPDSYPGAISDPVLTCLTKVLFKVLR